LYSLTRRRFLSATGGAIGLTAAASAPASPAGASAADPTDRVFTTQSVLANGYGAVQLSKGVMPATGRIWQLRRVFWNVNFYGTVATGVQTYLYRLPSSLTRAQAMAHMQSSLDGWLGCCGNSQLTGNGDMTFDANEVLIRARQLLWIAFIMPASYNGFYMAAGMSVREQPG
jgi:hypothetical protein